MAVKSAAQITEALQRNAERVRKVSKATGAIREAASQAEAEPAPTNVSVERRPSSALR